MALTIGLVSQQVSALLYLPMGSSVNIYDEASDTIIDTIPVGVGAIFTAVNDETNIMYVSNRPGNTVSVIDLTSDMAIIEDTNTIYLVRHTFPSPGTVDVIDGDTNDIITTITAGIGIGPTDVEYNTANNTIYVVNHFAGTLAVIDPVTNTVVGTIPVGSSQGPNQVSVNPVTNTIYVANQANNLVFVIDGNTNTVVDTISVGRVSGHVNVNPTTNTIYVANSFGNTVSVIDGNTNTVVATVPVGAFPVFPIVDIATNRILVSNSGSSSISVIDGATNSVTKTILLTEPVGELVILEPNFAPQVQVDSVQKISSLEGGFGAGLDIDDLFGHDVTEIGDLDGDGVTDMAVGVRRDDDGGFNTGAVWILFLNADGTVKSKQKISETQGGFGGSLSTNGVFGANLENLGDIDGDGVTDLVIGNFGDDDGGLEKGAVWVVFLNTDGTVKGQQKISSTQGSFGAGLNAGDRFGRGVANIGDLDGDGVTDIAVGAFFDDDAGLDRGAVWILFMNSNGTVKAKQKISDTEGGFSGLLNDFDWFGTSVAGIGDVDRDGVTDLVVGAPGDDDGGTDRGAIWVLFMNASGTVKAEQKISDIQGGLSGQLDDNDWFGYSVGRMGDLDLDGTPDIAVGARLHDDGGPNRGAVWLLFLNTDGTIKAEQKISSTEGNFTGTLHDSDAFSSVTHLPDLNGDGITDLAVGAFGDDDGGIDKGAVWIVFLDVDSDGDGVSDNVVIPDDAVIGEGTTVSTGSIINTGVSIGTSGEIGSNVVLNKNTQAGDNVVVDDGTIINQATVIGDDTMIGANVNIGKNCTIGARSIIGDNTTIGRDCDIGNDVMIGTGVTIGRNVVVLDETVVPDGTIIGNDTTVPPLP